ncbi:MAG: SRPBCC family protein [Phycisphaeraceae bacterium]
MPTIEITTDIRAPIEASFDLTRDIGFHVRSLEHTGERAIAGRTDSLIERGETVTWQATHLGMTRQMTVKITAMDRPTHFRDEQTDGPFKSFVHDHAFEELGNGVTRMTDRIDFASPFGWVGSCVDRLYLRGYLRRLIEKRAGAIEREAECRALAVAAAQRAGVES